MGGIPRELLERLIRVLYGEISRAGSKASLRPELFDAPLFAKEAISFAEERAGELAQITPAQREKLAGIVSESLREGWSSSRIADELRGISIDPMRLARTEPALAQNTGTILRLEAEGFTLFRVWDSSGCLPTGHRDGAPKATGTEGVVEEDREANGQVWTAEQCKARRLAHPNCERSFTAVVRASDLRKGA